jgi:tRNA-2-methylthio-N6-dimethylallyladenosine synthase
MNFAEAASMERILSDYGWEKCESAKDNNSLSVKSCQSYDLVIINTCTVRATAEQRILGRLAHYVSFKKTHSFKILITGCAASRIAFTLKKNGADYVVGTQEKRRFLEILKEIDAESQYYTEFTNLNLENKSKAYFEENNIFAKSYYKEGACSIFVPIMHGCNNFCSYCIVPYVRGPEVSRRVIDIIAEIKQLAEKKVSEITLLGQNVNAFYQEADEFSRKSFDFTGLMQLIANEIKGTSIKWVRFLSSHPKDMSDKLIEVISSNDCFCRHIHLPVQHGSDRILNAMNRRYKRADYINIIKKLRFSMPDITLSTDILIGFPGETEADFEQILDLMDEVRFNYAFMYHYNPREGTVAFDLPYRISEEIKRERLSRVINLQNMHTRQALNRSIDKECVVLVESVSRKNNNEFLCRSEHDEMCVTPYYSDINIGDFLTVRFKSLNGNTFKAERV